MDEQGIDRALMFPPWPAWSRSGCGTTPSSPTPPSTPSTSGSTRRGRSTTRAGSSPRRSSPCPSWTGPSRSSSGCSSAGAKVVLIRPAPVPGYRGPRSFGLQEFDPFWQKVVDNDVLVAMHSSDSGYERYTNDWMGSDSEMLPFQPQAFRMLSAWRPVEDAVSALVCHGALSRFPDPQGRGRRERQQLGRAAAEEHGRHVQEDAPGLRSRTRSTSSSGTSTSAPSGRRTSAPWPS